MRHRPVWRCAGALERLIGLGDARINEDEDRCGASVPDTVVGVAEGVHDG